MYCPIAEVDKLCPDHIGREPNPLTKRGNGSAWIESQIRTQYQYVTPGIRKLRVFVVVEFRIPDDPFRCLLGVEVFLKSCSFSSEDPSQARFLWGVGTIVTR